jgi:hypothetical protein
MRREQPLHRHPLGLASVGPQRPPRVAASASSWGTAPRAAPRRSHGRIATVHWHWREGPFTPESVVGYGGIIPKQNYGTCGAA